MQKLIPESFLLALLISAVPFENQTSRNLNATERNFGIFENEVTVGDITFIGELEYNPSLQEYSFLFSEDQKVDGDEPKVIAYVYGGQGTINVPSWSGDSKHISFVTNTACY
ncbi:hypothetical protein LB467_09815 [Salegentibacter sp. JZCK2]|uniref:hypothetical protein n=1 Tax=Salegentibacter tibetensis TaxID=2873600 RepID=UPI001CCEA18D|nr:hypothetical protein [Salegentibacter tibetensis]MBZ9729981.1 hypothetical protein [Salegentibacter tibetensis]